MSEAKNLNDFAIVIGINDYESPEHVLTSPEQDAKRVTNWLIDKEGGGLEPAHCLTLPGEDCGPITRQLIEDQLIKARQFSKRQKHEGKAARRLYFYFSGHGLATEADAVLMCHGLWTADRPNANINSQDLEKHYLNSCTLFDEVVIWLDCCRNRSIITKPGSLDVGCAPRPDAANQKTMLAFATLDGSYAFEGLTAEDDNSVFTEALLQGLKQSDDGQGQVSWRSLKNYLEEYVPSIAAEQNKAQSPQVDFIRLLGSEDPVFCLTAIDTVTIEFDTHSGLLTILDQKFAEVVKDHDLASGSLAHPLPVGRYLATTGTARKPFEVNGVDEVITVNFNG